jgi:hypothetical protein
MIDYIFVSIIVLFSVLSFFYSITPVKYRIIEASNGYNKFYTIQYKRWWWIDYKKGIGRGSRLYETDTLENAENELLSIKRRSARFVKRVVREES